MTVANDFGTAEGLRQALTEITSAGSWDGAAGRRLLEEIRHRAVRHAAHLCAGTDKCADRGLVDDLVGAAWWVLDRYARQVIGAANPWAYLMSAARRRVRGEIRAHGQLMSTSSSERATAAGYAPLAVMRAGSAAADLATAFRHEWARSIEARVSGQVVLPAIRRPTILLAGEAPELPDDHRERERWFEAVVGLLVEHGADKAVTIEAIDRLADLLSHTKRKLWETAARRDPVLARLGLTPDQCGALVALLAGSRRERAAGESDGLLATVRAAQERGAAVELSLAQRRRVRVYVGGPRRSPALRQADPGPSQSAELLVPTALVS